MVFNIKELEKKLIDKDLNRKLLAKKIGISPNTLTYKLEKPQNDFKISEAAIIANELSLTDEEFMMIFFGKKLSFNEIQVEAPPKQPA